MMKTFSKFSNIVFFRVVLAFAVLIALGCSSPTSHLIGKWSDEKNLESIEFFKDNTHIWRNIEGKSISGKWKVLDDGRIKIKFDSLKGRIMGKIERGNLILDIGNEKTVILHKVK